MQIYLKTIPHDQQRYDTLGDYRGGVISISKLGKEDYEFLIALHELIEMYLTTREGIAEKDITKFDMAFKGEGEPGDDRSAPYYKQHQIATRMERQMAYEMGIDWNEYEAFLNEFIKKQHEDK